MPINLSGSLVLTGSITTTGTISMSGSIASASYALNTSFLNNSGSGEFVPTGSFNTFSSSILTHTGSTITRLNSIEIVTGSNLTRLSSIESKTGSYATTGSNTFIGTQTISGSVLQSGSFTTTGTIIAQTINVQQVTSSIVYSCGSNIFGTSISNTQQLTGSVGITGSLTIAGASSATSYNGATIFGSTIACSPIGCFATSCATSFIGGTMSGTTIYGSTAVCSPVGNFTSCVTAASLRIDNNSNLIGNGRKIFGNDDAANYYIGDIGGTGGLTINWYGGIIMRTLDTERMRITSTGIACFACQVCAPSFISSGTICSTGNTCFGGMSIINNCLGIGTATPQFKLDIQGGSLGIYHNTNYSGGASGAQIYLGDMNFAGGVYACSAPGIGAVCSPSTGVAGDLAFYNYTGIAGCRTERMRIVAGNVGIGVTVPNAKLHVAGTIYSNVRCNTIDTDDGISNNFQGYGGYWALRTDESNGFNLDVYGGGTPKTVLNIPQTTGIACFSGIICTPKIGYNGYGGITAHDLVGHFASDTTIATVTDFTAYTRVSAHIDWVANYALAGTNMTMGYTITDTRRGNSNTMWVNCACTILAYGDVPVNPTFSWNNGVLTAYVPGSTGLSARFRIMTYVGTLTPNI